MQRMAVAPRHAPDACVRAEHADSPAIYMELPPGFSEGMSLVIARPFAGAPRGGGGARPICSADAPAGGAPKVRGAGVGAPAGRDGAASMDA